MKTMKNWLLSGLLFMVVSTVFSQGKITGTITDGQMGGSLPSANVLIKGTSTAVVTDIDGKFTLTSATESGELVITFLGYETKTVAFKVAANKTQNLGTIVLSSNSESLDDVVVTGVVDIAKDRKTPVAMSTIKAAEIQEKLGNQEFPEILNNTPSVYVTKGSGGFGDSRINIRGFDQKNIAIMVNGVPVNDMETSAVYWSNWAGISDVTTFMQVQRGLGSSKLAISSVGGTVNIVTRAADKKEGGTLSNSIGNDQYLKFLATYSTGKMDNGLSASVLFSRTTGDGYVDGTKFEAHNYFIGLGYEINAKNSLQLTFTGAPQTHNQRFTSPTIAQYRAAGTDGEPNKRYNRDFGTYNGEEYSFKSNYYHKPIASLNWDYQINETTKLATVLYGSWGRGGGSSAVGSIGGKNVYTPAGDLRTPDGQIDINKINAYNSGQAITLLDGTVVPARAGDAGFGGGQVNSSGSGISKIASVNSHDWYGGVISLNKKFGQNFTFDIGADVRTYKGMHYQNVNDLLGAGAFKDNSDVNNPNRYLTGQYASEPSGNPWVSTSYQQRLGFNNDGKVNWVGGFTQLEYATEKLTAFIQGALSNEGFKRIDHFKYLSTDPLSETKYENILGGNVKGGVNYNLNEQHNVYVNAGYYSKQPFFNAVYPNNTSIVNPYLTNEKITGFEAGYGFRSSFFTANVNVYYTSWKDRNLRQNITSGDNAGGYLDFRGLSEIHTGVELEMTAKITDDLRLNGMFSMGSWSYDGNAIVNTYDVSNNPIGAANQSLYMNGVKVGDAAQTTASVGATYKVVKGLSVDANYRFNDKLYALISPQNFTSPNNQGSLELPSYGLMDAGVTFRVPVGKSEKQNLNFRFNMNNVLNKLYISESRTNTFAKTQNDFMTGGAPDVAAYNAYQATLYKGLDPNNQVYFGFGRTWNFSVAYNF
ncbi:TonB-dependent receptor [Flavobacterium kingsejongi]|uniref:TonB-dependent receptor n=1 Tax=Flavobacterium kingsejongi TaxID=1678728 RepID=A0A2S1LKQ7_9FLAO|nr:TonB-dependent receptor [Flavobacterium kingsejongi]AWG24362.1 TonB-dependent receptor [Flavobacterium kingsejongi]